jgi:type VI secretion system secreted protein VgrG
VSYRGAESLSELYAVEIELAAQADGPELSARELVGACAALKMETRTEPRHRLIHGVVRSATELDLVDPTGPARLRLELAPPLLRATMMPKSAVYLHQTLRQIVDAVLQRGEQGAALEPSSSAPPLLATEQLERYAPPRQSYCWRVRDTRRLDAVEARPFCVQYDESDFDFVARLLEEEGIAYHFEHSDDECLLVLSDSDAGRPLLDAPVGPSVKGREVFDWAFGGVLRPRSLRLDDYDWLNPKLDLAARGPSGGSDFGVVRQPGRYQHSAELGQALAEKLEQRFDTERTTVRAQARCRALGAGQRVVLDHPRSQLCGTFLVTAVHFSGHQRQQADAEGAEQAAHSAQLQLLPCGEGGALQDSRFRPARRTRRPRIYGTQTAVVTADPSDPEAEIHVGGPSDLGCVRLRFHWDLDDERCAREPSSCWVRVSQFFAGSDHGALWHPRVGDEVIVEYLDGDPDRPIITGRVYNGTRLPPENATARPTYSAIKSLSSPHDGNYNMIAFDDLRGSEQIIVHAARDFVTNIKRCSNRSVGLHDHIHVTGNQTINIDAHQKVTVGDFISISASGSIDTSSENDISFTATNNFNIGAGGNIEAKADKHALLQGGVSATVTAPLTAVHGGTATSVTAGATLTAHSGGVTVVSAGASVTVNGPIITVNGGTVVVEGGSVRVKGAPVNIEGGTVNVKGSEINLN